MKAVKTADRPTGPLRDDLVVLSRAIHGTPELAYQERQAVGNIAALLKRHGHDVELNLGYRAKDAETAVDAARKELGVEAEFSQLLRASLRQLTR